MDSPLQCDCETYAILISYRVLVDGTCKSPDEVKDLDIRPNFISKAREEMCKDTKPKCSGTSKLIINVTMTIIFTALLIIC